MKFILRTLPPSPNWMLRAHWSKRRKLKSNYAWEMLSQMKPLAKPGSIITGPGFETAHITITRYAVQLLDPDNLPASMKIPIDALRLAGVIVDDSPAHITLEVTQQRVNHRKEQRVEIEVTETG